MAAAEVLLLSGAVFLLPTVWGAQEYIVVKTTQGMLRGTRMTTWTDNEYFSFRGVRYAEPPTGSNRFKPPVPLKPWEGVRNATEDGPVCYQYGVEGLFNTSEDCLVLNIYTRQLSNKKKNSVIVFIHPGAFVGGTGASYFYSAEYLLSIKQVLLVTFNYRVDCLGYLSTGDASSPGNYGMKDQVAVLKWVKQNIANFGGDPDDVTITGYSAGGVSVELHMVSPMSRGLFHKAIAMSGACAASWAVNLNPLPQARQLAQLVNCENIDTQIMVNCLRGISAQKLVNQYSALHDWAIFPVMEFTPVIEPDLGYRTERFLSDNPLKLIQAGKFSQVPLVTGINTDEFASLALYIASNSTLIQELNTDWEHLAPIIFQYERDSNRSRAISQALRNFYFGDRPISNDTLSIDGLAKCFSDAIIIFGVYRSAKLFAQKSTKPVYYYDFSYIGRFSFLYKPGTSEPYGTSHLDDLIYLLHSSILFPLFNTTDPEAPTVRALTSEWANFARFGNPTPVGSRDDWLPLTDTALRYMSIGDIIQLMPGIPDAERMTLWEQLIPVAEAYNK